MVFDKSWFKIHQKKLLRFANTKFGRWVLCINGKKSAVGKNKIVRILPSEITWEVEPSVVVGDKCHMKLKSEFRTNEKFGLRLYHFFKPVWWTFHFLDWLVLDRFTWANRWSLNFLTLTQYPTASFIDGNVIYNAALGTETFAACRAGAGSAVDIAGNNLDAQMQASAVVNQYAQWIRVVLRFDTSSLTASASISATTLTVTGGYKSNDLGGGALCVVSWTAGSIDNTLTATDYAVAKFGSTEWATRIAYASFDAAGANVFTFNATGLAGVSKTSTTKIGAMEAHDFDNSAPTWSSGGVNILEFASSRTVGTGSDPTLVVTYTIVVPAIGGTLSMMGI